MRIELIGTLTKILPSEFYEKKDKSGKGENFQILVTKRIKDENDEITEKHYAVKVFVNSQNKSPNTLKQWIGEKVKVVCYLKSNQDRNNPNKWYNDVSFGSIEKYVAPEADEESPKERSYSMTSNPSGGNNYPAQESIRFPENDGDSFSQSEPDTDDLPF